MAANTCINDKDQDWNWGLRKAEAVKETYFSVLEGLSPKTTCVGELKGEFSCAMNFLWSFQSLSPLLHPHKSKLASLFFPTGLESVPCAALTRLSWTRAIMAWGSDLFSKLLVHSARRDTWDGKFSFYCVRKCFSLLQSGSKHLTCPDWVFGN